MDPLSVPEQNLLILAIGFMIIAGALGAWYEFRRRYAWAHAQGVWLPIPSDSGIAGYWRCAAGMQPIDEDHIREACRETVTLLERHTGLTRAKVWAALNGVRILVGSVDSYPHPHGTQRTYAQGVIVVGPTLSILAHELMHVLEARTMSEADITHALWKLRQFDVVDKLYRQSSALSSRPVWLRG